jgi:hypothetical protein
MTSPRNQFIFSGRNVARVSLWVILITVLLVWLAGFRTHRSLMDNALLSTTIISSGLFIFLFIGLYKGAALHNDIRRRRPLRDDDGDGWLDGLDIPEELDSDGCLAALLLWLVVGLLAFVVNALLPVGLEGLGLAGLLYWGFFRALNLVFSNSIQCQGNWRSSLGYALLFTALYCGWVYGVIYLVDWL